MATHQSKLNSCIHSVWLKKQTLNGTSGAIALICWGGVLFLAGMLIDWLTFMPAAGRVVLFSIMLTGALVMAWRSGWKKIRTIKKPASRWRWRTMRTATINRPKVCTEKLLNPSRTQ